MRDAPESSSAMDRRYLGSWTFGDPSTGNRVREVGVLNSPPIVCTGDSQGVWELWSPGTSGRSNRQILPVVEEKNLEMAKVVGGQ